MATSLIGLFGRNIRRFRGAQGGSTAVEFAFIAPALIGVLAAIFETALYLFAQANLQYAAGEAGRQFMTGQAQNSGMTQSQFKAVVCPMVQMIFNCNNLTIVVQNYSSFASASTSAPTLYNSSCQANTASVYNPGTPGNIMVIQLAYAWPLITGPLGFTLANECNGTVEVMGVSAFRVEPYQSSPS
jgi:Flp pilus assembly protein TadG